MEINKCQEQKGFYGGQIDLSNDDMDEIDV
jgi:hypothetical protein